MASEKVKQNFKEASKEEQFKNLLLKKGVLNVEKV